LASSIARKDEDSSRDLWSPHPPPLPATLFAVRRLDGPVAFPHSHGMPCHGLVLGGACARLILADKPNVPCCTDISEEVKWRDLPGLKARVSTPRSG
jgi:hypothetical protein